MNKNNVFKNFFIVIKNIYIKHSEIQDKKYSYNPKIEVVVVDLSGRK